MDLVLSVDDKVGAFVEGLAKFVADVKKITGPGAQGAVAETAELLTAAVSDLVPAFANFSEVEASLKAKPIEAAVALQAALVSALAL